MSKLGNVKDSGNVNMARKRSIEISTIEGVKAIETRRHSLKEKPFHQDRRNATSYIETVIHLIKGNIGSGIFAMAEAYKHAGLLLGPIMTISLGFICLYCEHALLGCSKRAMEMNKLSNYPPYSETVQLSFESGPRLFRRLAKAMKTAVNFFLIVTHIGFCCVYIVFISSTSKQIFDSYHLCFSLRLHMLIMIIPVMLSSLLRTLKLLVPISLAANIFFGFGIVATIYIMCQDLPPITSRPFVSDWKTIPLCFGAVVFGFEGIGLVLPLKSEMKKPEDFDSPFGVLNLGMALITTICATVGFLGYLQYGDAVQGSVTLNLPSYLLLSKIVKVSIGMGILLTYTLMFYIVMLVIWPYFSREFGPFRHPIWCELLCRCGIVLLTLVLAEFIPHIGLFISLLGSFSTASISLVAPPLSDIAVRWPCDFGRYYWRLVLDLVSLLVAAVGMSLGIIFSLKEILETFYSNT